MITYVNVRNQQEYDELMVILEKQGALWNDGQHPTENNYFKYHKENTIIGIDGNNFGKRIHFGQISEIKSRIISFYDFSIPEKLVTSNLNKNLIKAIRGIVK